jgi:alkylation response protein AidB-like acyl-CoA dehydrogenase
MLLEFDADQRLWQETVRDAVAKQCPPSLVRSIAENGVDPSPLWKTYIDAGWTELTDPENTVELAIVLEELGRGTDPTPFLATLTQFAPLAADRFDPAQVGTAIYGGVTAHRDADGWVLNGTAHHVLDGDRAEKFAVVTEAGVFVVEAGVAATRRSSVFDPVLHVAEVTFSGVHVPDSDRVHVDAERAHHVALTGMAITTVGACQRILDLALEHVKQRQQFGVAIGSFQAVQHKAVDMHVATVLKAELTASLGMSEPSAGSDLASLRTRAVLDGDHFVVNGQKVWTSGAHDADFLLTFVRTDPDAPKHKGISALIIPTDTPGVVCRPFADICGEENLDFNEVFFTDARVPVENLVGPLNGGWGVANGSLGHERTMMWLGFADRIDNLIADFRPQGELQRDQYATMIMDYQALRAMGSAALARAARGEMDTASVSVLKLFGSEAEMRATEHALTAAGADGLIHPSTTGRYAHMNLDHYFASWFERYARSFSGTIAGGTSEIQRNIIATQVLGLPRR